MYFDIAVEKTHKNQNWTSETWLISSVIFKVFSIHIFFFYTGFMSMCTLLSQQEKKKKRKTKTEDWKWKETKEILVLVVPCTGREKKWELKYLDFIKIQWKLHNKSITNITDNVQNDKITFSCSFWVVLFVHTANHSSWREGGKQRHQINGSRWLEMAKAKIILIAQTVSLWSLCSSSCLWN